MQNRSVRVPAVVCGVDASPEAVTAIHVARRLSRAFGLPLVLVHVGRIAPVPRTRLGRAVVSEAIDHFRGIALEAGERVLDDQIARAGAEEGERRVVIGDPVTELLFEAERQRAAAIVVGTRGRRPLTAAVLGSVSAAVVSGARCPVVVVGPGGHDALEATS